MHAIRLHIIASLMAIGLTEGSAIGIAAAGLIPPLVLVCLYVCLLPRMKKEPWFYAKH
jgi:hypothetical protein